MVFVKLVIISILSAISIYYLGIFIKGSLCHLNHRIDGKVVLITGANTGIGLETALELAKRGGIIHMACRDEQKCIKARDHILSSSNIEKNRVFTHIVDLGSTKSILTFAKQFKNEVSKLDILINNAGIMMCPYSETEDGFEMQIGVNHLGHFLLTNELLDIIKAADSARIIIVSSKAHERGVINVTDINLRGDDYGRIKAYSQSKFANVLHAKYLANMLKEYGVTVVSLHPGVVQTELMRHVPGVSILEKIGKYIMPYVMKTPFEGAQTSICCAVNPDLHKHSGEYFSDCQPLESTNPQSNNETLAKLLWDQSKLLVDSKIKPAASENIIDNEIIEDQIPL